MYRTHIKAIVFLIGFIFLIAASAGAVSTTICDLNQGGGIQAATTGIMMVIISETDYNLTRKPIDLLFKGHKQGVKNLRTISTGGIPPKGFDEIVADNMSRTKSMISTAKTKITHIFSLFYKTELK